ncbi:MAG: hypothetical protein H6707_05135 [Deltaproteobacteria bacterium]|nr:hypothetical protein [Deltaproteobacteria bacterium]
MAAATLADALNDPKLLARWRSEFATRAWLPGPVGVQARARLDDLMDAIVEALQRSAASSQVVALGQPEWREPLQQLSFVAGWMAGEGLPVSAALLLCKTLRDALGVGDKAWFEQLEAVVVDAHSFSQRDRAQLEHNRVVARAQVLCLIEPRLPLLFVVADPDRQALHEVIGRLMTVVATRACPTVVVDVSAAMSPEQALSDTLTLLAEYDGVPEVLLCGVAEPVAARAAAAGRRLSLVYCEQLAAALERGRAQVDV